MSTPAAKRWSAPSKAAAPAVRAEGALETELAALRAAPPSKDLHLAVFNELGVPTAYAIGAISVVLALALELLVAGTSRLAGRSFKAAPVAAEIVEVKALPDPRAEAVALHRKGLAQGPIAAELGVSQPTVSRWLREAGEPTRRKLRVVR